ncbi:MAG: DNA-processing protein DprA [bacterium]
MNAVSRVPDYEIVERQDPAYPALLKKIHYPPQRLYVRGRLIGDEMCVAVVGARKASSYGKMVAEYLGEELAHRGIAVVSGMARGVDTAAHRGALRAGGRTIAVLGCGIDVVYPQENRGLMEEIAKSGAVITEFTPGEEPKPWHFPARNRIISGMALGTVVVEAGERSGSLITANFALEEGREVFAVPGQIKSPGSQGTHALIKQGAKLVEDIQDVLEELQLSIENRGKPRRAVPTSEEQKLLVSLGSEGRHTDEVIAESGMSAAQVTALLAVMELKGLVRRNPGNIFIPLME